MPNFPAERVVIFIPLIRNPSPHSPQGMLFLSLRPSLNKQPCKDYSEQSGQRLASQDVEVLSLGGSDSLRTRGLQPRQASLSFTIPWSLLKLMSIELVMPSNHLILCCHLLLLPSIFPSIRVFSSELALHIRSPKYWS